MPEKLYKVLKRNDKGHLVSCNGGSQVWTTGVRVEAHDGGPLVPCKNGIHACREQNLIHWLDEVICPVVDASKERIVHNDKVVLRWAVIGAPLPTWNERTARLFACDCAEWALSLLDKPDAPSIEAVRVARLFAIGEATCDELAAAGSAARAAAGSAAWYAAWDAAGSAAGYAARAAAGDVAWYAAWYAAGDAAGDAAWAYMTERLMEYLNA